LVGFCIARVAEFLQTLSCCASRNEIDLSGTQFGAISLKRKSAPADSQGMSKVIGAGMVILLGVLAAQAAGPSVIPIPGTSASNLAIFGAFALATAAVRKFFKG
jgi:hypothetical protein